VFVGATPPSVSSGVLFGVGALHVPRPNHASTLKKGQVDVFSLVFVSADNSIFRDLTIFFSAKASVH